MNPRASAHIRPLKPSDIHACNGIVSESEPWKSLGERVAFARLLEQNRQGIKSYVCISDKTVAGFIVFSPAPVFARGGYLRAIAVAPGMRKRGVGGKLLVFAERITARYSPNFYLCVSSFNRSAQTFYRKQGYSRVGSIPGLIVPHAAEYVFWKKLVMPCKSK